MIVAVVLTYAAPEGMVEACVDSLLAADHLHLVVVVDNGDRAAARLADRPVEVVVTGDNLGFAGGMNVGIRRALALGAEHVLILNDDVVVEPGFVAPLVGALRADERLGVVQPKLLLPGEPVRIASMGVALGLDGAGVDVAMGESDGPELAADRTIEAFTGGAALLSARFLADVGLFDERYFMYYEDVDLSLRGAERGWTYRCVAGSRVVHEGGVSAWHETVRLRTVYLRERNRVWTAVRFRPGGVAARAVWLSVRRLRWAPRRTHAVALAAALAAVPRLVVARRRASRSR